MAGIIKKVGKAAKGAATQKLPPPAGIAQGPAKAFGKQVLDAMGRAFTPSNKSKGRLNQARGVADKFFSRVSPFAPANIALEGASKRAKEARGAAPRETKPKRALKPRAKE